jgi:hypothetical protein
MDDSSQARQYFSERQRRGPNTGRLPLEAIRRLVVSVLDGLREQGYMQEAFGIECVDGDSDGTLGSDLDAYFLRTIMREGVWPYWSAWLGPPAPYLSWDADPQGSRADDATDAAAAVLQARQARCGRDAGLELADVAALGIRRQHDEIVPLETAHRLADDRT